MEYLIIIMEDSKTLICCLKFPWVRKRFSFKFIDNLGTRLHRRSLALA